MSFHEIEFPRRISFGSRGGPKFNTQILETDGGHEYRVSRWTAPLHEYDVNYGIKKLDDLAEVKRFFAARRGAAFGFRYWDPLDYTTAINGRSVATYLDQIIGAADGVTTQFQLVKTYQDDAGSWTRVLNKPVEGKVSVGVAGVLAGAGWAVDVTTGILTFSVAPVAGAVTAGCEFNTPVRFSKETDNSFTASVDQFDSGSIPAMKVVEIRPEASVADAPYMGGTKNWAIQTNVTLSPGLGRLNIIQALNVGRRVMLPDPTDLPPGGPYFAVMNVGANSFDIYFGATNLGTVATSESVEFWLGLDNVGAKFWIMR